jgi:hypothetical protein
MSKLLDTLGRVTGLSENDLHRIIRNAPIRYKDYYIPKRNGGERLISHPARELKELQRALVTEVLSKLPVHEAASAYRPGKSIKDNANVHVRNSVILKFDFANFFPSIVARDWHTYCDRNKIFEDWEDVLISANILFHRPRGSSILRLAIGAPSSPFLSNILMKPFDEKITELVSADQISYTRYADDLTFSAKRTGFLTHVEKNLRQVIREISSPSLSINANKTVLATRKYKRMVTGLILANDGNVSLGHERKRRIRAAVDYARKRKLTIDEQKHLSGLLAFAQNVDPDFYTRLVQKYGAALIAQIKASVRTG